ncbi:hypothetical protein CBL_04624 [Carabus blaptoides fortunei]
MTHLGYMNLRNTINRQQNMEAEWNPRAALARFKLAFPMFFKFNRAFWEIRKFDLNPALIPVSSQNSIGSLTQASNIDVADVETIRPKRGMVLILESTRSYGDLVAGFGFPSLTNVSILNESTRRGTTRDRCFNR